MMGGVNGKYSSLEIRRVCRNRLEEVLEFELIAQQLGNKLVLCFGVFGRFELSLELGAFDDARKSRLGVVGLRSGQLFENAGEHVQLVLSKLQELRARERDCERLLGAREHAELLGVGKAVNLCVVKLHESHGLAQSLLKEVLVGDGRDDKRAGGFLLLFRGLLSGRGEGTPL